MNYGHLEFEKSSGQWVVSQLKPHVAIRFKQLFPGVRKSSTGPFPLNDTLDNASDLLWFTQRYTLTATKPTLARLKRQSKKYTRLMEDAEAILCPGYIPTSRAGLKPGQKLRNYQLAALDFINTMKSLLLIDDVGLGKTYEGLGIALTPANLPLVIICEPHLQAQWGEKAEEFIDLKVHLVKGNKPYDLPSADIYIAKYSQLSPWVDVFTQRWIKAIAFDEVQQLRRGTESNKGEAAKAICNVVPVRVGLTATLIYNYGIEAWNIIDILRPGLLGSTDEFRREWCNNGGVVSDPDALGAYLRETQMILRRTKSDVGQEAKQTQPCIEWVDHSTKAIDEAERLAESLAIKTLSGSFEESGRAAREFDMRMRLMTGVAKAVQVAGFVRMFVETGTPILLFGWHHEVYEIWKKELSDLNPLFYTGQQTQSQKDANKKAFLSGESDILIMSLRSGAGTDGLQHRASTVVFGEFDWSPKVHHQCIGRLDRDGQEDEVFSFYVATNFGSDPVVLDVLGLKESQSRGIQDPGTAPVSQQVDRDRIKRLARSYLSSKGKTIPHDKNEKQLSLIEMAGSL